MLIAAETPMSDNVAIAAGISRVGERRVEKGRKWSGAWFFRRA